MATRITVCPRCCTKSYFTPNNDRAASAAMRPKMNTLKSPNRVFRTAKAVFRMTRNILAILGVCFVYLFVTGVMQYQDRLAAGDTTCTLTHCV